MGKIEGESCKVHPVLWGVLAFFSLVRGGEGGVIEKELKIL